jgi:hypothetical protein
MQQFFETQDNKFVNLRETTSIAFEEQKGKFKIIFNMNYGITLGTGKIISDYIYSVYRNREYFEEDFYYLMGLVDEYQWIKCKEPRIINPDHISFVTQDPNKNRVIINIASSVSFHDNKSKTSDFVYINLDNKKEYQDYLSGLREQLESLIL